ncbi:MAG: RNA polymerase sigma factor [Gammaproteobacteria bacterium]
MKGSASNKQLLRKIADSRTRLYQVALAWCSDEMVADDLVQETLACGIVNAQQLRDESCLFAWLYSILHNNWVKYLRKNKPHLELDDSQPADIQGPMHDCQELEIVCRVRKAVASLSEDQRKVIALVDLEEFSYQKVSDILGIPIGTVMSRLYRARKRLLSKLQHSQRSTMANPVNVRLVK